MEIIQEISGAQLKRLVSSFPPRRPGIAPGQVMWDFFFFFFFIKY
jgi:hypothetical protein